MQASAKMDVVSHNVEATGRARKDRKERKGERESERDRNEKEDHALKRQRRRERRGLVKVMGSRG